MPAPPSYEIACLQDGRYRLDRIDALTKTRVAYAKPATDRFGDLTGWKLQPIVVLQGSCTKVWLSPAEALASTKLMTAAVARRLIDAPRSTSTAGDPT